MSKEKKNKVFIATSLDGFIADAGGGIDWLHSVPNPDNNDMGYGAFMSTVDAIVMGRKTFETVCNFGIEWPYEKPVFVLSNTLTDISDRVSDGDKVELLQGPIPELLQNIHARGYRQLYIDGGSTIQNFLREDLIDEMTITVMPYLLGEGIALFGSLPQRLEFECVNTRIYLGKVVQNHFIRSDRPY